MNRIFHARIVWYQYFLLVVLGVNAFGFLWCKNIILATLMMLFLIVVIEQIILFIPLRQTACCYLIMAVLSVRKPFLLQKLLLSGKSIL